MKIEIFNFLKERVGSYCSEHIQGFGGWLNGKILSLSDEGDIELAFEIRAEMLNPMGTIHGGALASILDEAMGMQLFIKSNNDEAFFAINLIVDFVKSSRISENLIAKPEIVRIGKKSANLRCNVYNVDGQLVAHGFSNFHKL